MDNDFSEEYSKFLLSKEWLVKIDNLTSTPYLIKFFSSTVDISCCVLVTDTKSVWVEVMTGSQFARRWRHCNNVSPPFFPETEEDGWRINMLELLTKAHTLGGITDLSFAVSESYYADHAFELENDSFKWRWETCFLGHRRSAEIISKHLILPLISLNHLAFSSAGVVADLPDDDVEKAVDKVGRTARRTVDTHIRNAMSKPLVATALRRMTAMFNFIPDLPPVISTIEKPDLQINVQALRTETRSDTVTEPQVISPLTRVSKEHDEPSLNSCGARYPLKDAPLDEKKNGRGDLANPIHTDSATESEGEEYVFPDKDKLSAGPSAQPPSTTSREPLNRDGAIFSPDPSPLPPTSRLNSQGLGLPSDSDSSPARPAKKPKKQVTSSSDDDSEEERKRRVAQLKSGAGGGPGGGKRGTRQPIRRGGKRF